MGENFAAFRVMPCGDKALLLQTSDPADRRLVDQYFTAHPFDGLIDQVPAMVTVLLCFSTRDHMVTARTKLKRMGGVELQAGAKNQEEVTDIAVHYDGEDLADVGEGLSMSPEAVISWHTGQIWTVEFAGFMPGFGYLTGENQPAVIPRRTSPRTRVPAGSVALAASFTGLYPQASPGGWQIIGNTEELLWDSARQSPALLSPGRRVRFQPVAPGDPAHFGPSFADAAPIESLPPEVLNGPGLDVLSVGPQVLIEDLGRPGYGRLGISESGAGDRKAAALANQLLGNAFNEPVLEILLGGLVVRAADADVTVVVTGPPTHIRVDGKFEFQYAPIRLRQGQTLSIAAPLHGARNYLAVRGGFAAPQLFDSASTDPTTGLGPLPIKAGARIPLAGHKNIVRGAARSGSTEFNAGNGEASVRVVLGPRDDWFTPEAIRALTSTPWQVSDHADRVGVRLVGPGLERAITDELQSEGVVRGAIQVPASGEPLIFLADHPTTGGYPVIAVVADEDIDKFAQVLPGQTVRFEVARHN